MSTRETAVEMSFLRQLDAEILIGQLSYKQRAEIYNYKHGHDKAKKRIRLNAEAKKLQAEWVFLIVQHILYYIVKSMLYGS